jgi:hypothetical protein
VTNVSTSAQPAIQRIPLAQAFQDQKPGTSGLRKSSQQFEQPGYLESFIEAILRVLPGVQGGTLVVGGCQLSELAQRYGTPLYVLDEATLRANCRAYRQALEQFYPGPSLALYASKANSSLAISALVASEGLGLDAVSAGELLTALAGALTATGLRAETSLAQCNRWQRSHGVSRIELGNQIGAASYLTKMHRLQQSPPEAPIALYAESDLERACEGAR